MQVGGGVMVRSVNINILDYEDYAAMRREGWVLRGAVMILPNRLPHSMDTLSLDQIGRGDRIEHTTERAKPSLHRERKMSQRLKQESASNQGKPVKVAAVIKRSARTKRWRSDDRSIGSARILEDRTQAVDELRARYTRPPRPTEGRRGKNIFRAYPLLIQR